MAEEFEPITFTKTDDRGDHELVASSPADAVRLRFDGWRVKGAKPRKAAGKSTGNQTAGPTAG